MRRNEKLIVLDSSTGEVHIFPYDGNIHEDPEDFLDCDDIREIISPSNSVWMVTNGLKIKIH